MHNRSALEAGVEVVDLNHIVETAVSTWNFFDTRDPSLVMLDLRKVDVHLFDNSVVSFDFLVAKLTEGAPLTRPVLHCSIPWECFCLHKKMAESAEIRQD